MSIWYKIIFLSDLEGIFNDGSYIEVELLFFLFYLVS